MDIIQSAIQKGRKSLSEHESKQFLQSYHIPVTREFAIKDEDGLMSAVDEIGFPLVMKACAPTLNHKTESGMVFLDIRDKKDATGAFTLAAW